MNAEDKKQKKLLKKTQFAMLSFSEALVESLRFEGNDLEGISDAWMKQKILGILDGSVPIPGSSEESDQSPLSGKDAQFLRNLWASGMDYLPHEPMFHWLSPWLKIIYSGDYCGFLKMIENKKNSEIQELLSKRETMLNVSAIFHVVIGARSLAVENEMFHQVQKMSKGIMNVKNEHMKILIKLLTLGVDVNVHDIAGFTPLHHCCSAFGNEVTFKMAERLIRAGANVNSKNRFGETPLINLAMSTHYGAVELLLKNGADPYLKENDGCSAHSMTKFNPKMQSLFRESYKQNIKDKRRDPDYQRITKCSNCGKIDQENSKCTGCYLVWYCSVKCQKANWGLHKAQCSKTKSQYRICTYNPFFISSLLGKGKWVSNPIYSKPPALNDLKKRHFVVKTQISDDKSSIHVSNKDQSFSVVIKEEGNGDVYNILFEKISSEGFQGKKGYFHLILEVGDNESCQFRINPNNIFEEPW